MKYRKILFGLILATSLTTTAAYAQNPPSASPQNSLPSSTTNNTDLTSNTTRMVVRDAKGKQIGEVYKDTEGKLVLIKPSDLTDGLNAVDFSPNLLLVLLLTIICGGLGGIVFELLNLQGNLEKPHKPTEDELAAKLAYASRKNVIDLGVWARVIVGAAAAPPAMLFLRPESAFGLLAMSLVAGSAGTAVFRSLQERLLLAVAQQGNVEPETPAMKQNTKLDEAIDAFERLEQKVRKASVSEAETTLLRFPKGLTLEPKEFNEVWEFLIEAKGVENAKVDDAIEAFQELEKKVYNVSESPFGKAELRIPKDKDTTLDSKDFCDIKRLLREAKGVSETIVTRETQEVRETVASVGSSATTPPKPSEIDQKAKVDEAIDAFAELKVKILTVSTREANSTTLKFADNASIQQEDLDKVQKLMRELKGLFDITSSSNGKSPSPLAVQIDSKVKKVVDTFDKMVEKLSRTSVDKWVGSTTLQLTECTSLEQAELYEVDTLLYEIKGLQQRITISDSHTLTQTAASV